MAGNNQQKGPDQAAAQENLMKGMAFLEEHKKEAGIQVMDSGIQYKIVTKGKGGKTATLKDQVKCNYRGTLIDGTEFDSSYKRGEPAVFPVNGVIQGWQQVIPTMTVGEKVECWIPAELAYGMQGPPNIGPNQVLMFEIELLEIIPGK